MIATLMLSQGVPMLRSGDELSHTQQGNNNAYCQDNQISWLRWDLNANQQQFLEFVAKVIRLWRGNAVFQRRHFFQGREIRGAWVKDIHWLTSNGVEMSDADWHSSHARCLGMRLEGAMQDELDDRGRPLVGQTVLLMMNALPDPIPFAVPVLVPKASWRAVLDTSRRRLPRRRFRPGDTYALQPRSMAILQLRPQAAAATGVVSRSLRSLFNLHRSESLAPTDAVPGIPSPQA
jgi:glycogen operon protein